MQMTVALNRVGGRPHLLPLVLLYIRN